MNQNLMFLFEIVYVLLTLTATIVLTFIAIQSWVRWQSVAGKTFSWLMTIAALTSLCFTFMAIVQNPEIVFLWAKLRYIGIAFMAPLFLLFILEMEGFHDWLKLTRILLIFIIPLVGQLTLWFAGSSGLFLETWSTTRSGILSIEHVTYGDVWRIASFYNILCFCIAYGFLIYRAWRSPGARRRQALILLVGSFITGFASVLHGFGLVPATFPNLNPIGMACGSILFAISIFRYNALNLMPIAYDEVFHSLRDPVFVLNNHQELIAVNPAGLEMLDADESRIIGVKAVQIFSGMPEILSAKDDLIPRNTEVVTEVSGRSRTYDLRISMMTQRRRVVGLLVVLHDITERKLANARSFELSIEREKFRLLSSFIQYTSHDLRTPLSKMNLALHIARITEDKEKQFAKLDAIETEIANMTKIIEELHLLTRLESGIVKNQPKLYINQLVREVPDDLHKLIDEKSLTLTYQTDKNLFVDGDMELLQYAFQHILRNAALYSSDEGNITVESFQENTSWCIIRVNDSGMGIDAKHHHLIFDHFYKVNAARTSDGSGAGLGLAIVKKIAELHQGRISVHSTLGKGSTFELALPMEKLTPSPT